MAYIGYEDVEPAIIHRRIVPSLRKYYRTDGTFDLFDIKNNQANCLRYLAKIGEAGLVNNKNGDVASYGSYNISTNNYNRSNFNLIDIGYHNSAQWGVLASSGFILKFDNKAGLFPLFIGLYHQSGNLTDNATTADQNSHYLSCYKVDGTEFKIIPYSKKTNSDIAWTCEINDATKMIDWKDYDFIRGRARARDNSKYTSTSVGIKLQFIHRYSQSSKIYRYYS